MTHTSTCGHAAGKALLSLAVAALATTLGLAPLACGSSHGKAAPPPDASDGPALLEASHPDAPAEATPEAGARRRRPSPAPPTGAGSAPRRKATC